MHVCVSVCVRARCVIHSDYFVHILCILCVCVCAMQVCILCAVRAVDTEIPSTPDCIALAHHHIEQLRAGRISAR